MVADYFRLRNMKGYDRLMRIFRSNDAPANAGDPATSVGSLTVQRLVHEKTIRVYRVTFADGGRTNWHKHAGPQWLFVVDGRVRVQTAGSGFQDLDAGDTAIVAPGERHWHGAVPGSSGTHIAVNLDVNAATIWQEPVSDKEYAG